MLTGSLPAGTTIRRINSDFNWVKKGNLYTLKVAWSRSQDVVLLDSVPPDARYSPDNFEEVEQQSPLSWPEKD